MVSKHTQKRPSVVETRHTFSYDLGTGRLGIVLGIGVATWYRQSCSCSPPTGRTVSCVPGHLWRRTSGTRSSARTDTTRRRTGPSASEKWRWHPTLRCAGRSCKTWAAGRPFAGLTSRSAAAPWIWASPRPWWSVAGFQRHFSERRPCARSPTRTYSLWSLHL